MPAYSYRAVHVSGRVANGNRRAVNEHELAQHLTQSGLELIDAHIRKEKPLIARWKNLPPRKLAAFCAQMADMLKAGIPFVDSLQEMATATETGPLRDTLTDILRDIRHGTRIANAFATYGNLFPPVFIAILGAGEVSGDLPRTFMQLTRYAESRARTYEQMQRALRYPAFLMLVAVGVISFMMALVVPKVIGFLNTIDSQLPLMTKILIALSELFAAIWWQALLMLPLLAFGILFLRQHSERAALVVDATFLRLPVFGEVLRKLALARFAHSFAILYQSGIGVLASLRHARATLSNRALEGTLDDVIQQVQSGRILSQALNGFLPPSALRMIRVGEQTGRLEKSLDDLAASYDRETSESAERAIGMLEPVLTLFIGALLAWVVLAVLGPIYGSLSKISGGY